MIAAFDRLREGPEFTAWDEHVLSAFAASAASAVATAQDVAAGTLRRRIDAQEQERTRWARELHDETLQELAALKLLAAVARRAATPEQQSSSEIDLRVADNGRGFDSRAASLGFGLVGIRERASLADGTVEVDSEPGTGTTLRMSVPIAAGEVAREPEAAAG